MMSITSFDVTINKITVAMPRRPWKPRRKQENCNHRYLNRISGKCINDLVKSFTLSPPNTTNTTIMRTCVMRTITLVFAGINPPKFEVLLSWSGLSISSFWLSGRHSGTKKYVLLKNKSVRMLNWMKKTMHPRKNATLFPGPRAMNE